MALGAAANSSGYGPKGTPPARGGSGNGKLSGNSDDDEFSIEEYRKAYTDFLNNKSAELQEQRLSRHYYHGDQLTSDQLKTLKDRGQPATIRDKASRKINGVVGLFERLRQDPKAYGRNPKDEEGAEVATAVIRYVLDAANWNALSSNEGRNGAINGIFGCELDLIKGDQGDPDVDLNEVDNDTFFYDPRSFRHDFSDARYMGVAKWVHIDVAKQMFPDKEDEIDSLIARGPGSEGWQQRDREMKWTDSNEKRIFLVEHWHIAKDTWHCCYYCADTKLMSVESPFFDEKGKTISRYIMGSVNLDHDGDRYGFLRQLKTLIDELNALVSKRAHLIAMRRIIATKGAVDDVDKARKEAVRADGYLEINPLGDRDRFEFDDQSRLANIQHINEAIAEVKTEIENFGPNPALIGQGIENKSGRAIALLQQAGTAELGPALTNFRDWKIRVYRAVWTTVQHYWTAERWIRVTDNEGVAQYKSLNQMTLDPETGIPTIVNNVGALDVDIIIDEGPDTLNVMQDTFETLQALAQNGAMVPPKVLIMASNLPSSEKTKILKEMEQAQQPKPIDLEMMGAKLEGQKVENREGQAKADKLKVETAQIAGQAGLPMPGPPPQGGPSPQGGPPSSPVGPPPGGMPPGGPGAGAGAPGTMGGNVPPMGPPDGAGAPTGGPADALNAMAAGPPPPPPPPPEPVPVPPPPPPPPDPEVEAKAKLSEAQAFSHRASGIKASAEASKTLAEVRLMQAPVRQAEAEALNAEEATRFQRVLVESIETQNQAIARQTAIMAQAMEAMARVMAAPKRIIADEMGRPVGVETIGAQQLTETEMPLIADSVFDAGLATITSGGTRIDICSQEPTSYGQATTAGTYSLGNKTGLTTGAAANGTVSGRRVTVPAITSGAPGAITNTGTATHWALTNGSSVLYAAGALTSSQAVTSGNTFTLDAIDVTIADAT